MSYRNLQAEAASELDRIRRQSVTGFQDYERAHEWLRLVLPDLDPSEHLAAIRFVVELKRAHGSVTKAEIVDVLDRYREEQQ